MATNIIGSEIQCREFILREYTPASEFYKKKYDKQQYEYNIFDH